MEIRRSEAVPVHIDAQGKRGRTKLTNSNLFVLPEGELIVVVFDFNMADLTARNKSIACQILLESAPALIRPRRTRFLQLEQLKNRTMLCTVFPPRNWNECHDLFCTTSAID